FLGGGVCYSAATKIAIAGVAPALIREHGEVSEPVAVALARGIRQRFDATYGVGVTGIAGPGGGTPEKPVGTVHIAVAGPSGEELFGKEWVDRVRLDSPMSLEVYERAAVIFRTARLAGYTIRS